tara:strand:- start:117 stop:371 length:255 start_codon:yes stop_codon:yes gene_type:complete
MSWKDILKADKEKTLINRLKNMAKKTGQTLGHLLLMFIMGKKGADFVRETGFRIGQFTDEEIQNLESYADEDYGFDPLYMPDDF